MHTGLHAKALGVQGPPLARRGPRRLSGFGIVGCGTFSLSMPKVRQAARAAALVAGWLAFSLTLTPATPARAEGLNAPAPEAFAPTVLSPRGETLLLEPPAEPAPEGPDDDAETSGISTRQSALSLLPQARRKGLASWYGLKFHRRRTASGEPYDMHGLTAAHPSLPFGTRVCVLSRDTGRSVVVRINDRSAYSSRRVIDLSKGAASALGIVGLGLKPVELSVLAPGHTECAP